MGEPEENLPEFFRIDYYGQYFIGELFRVDLEGSCKFTGSIQYFDNFVTCIAPSKRELLNMAEELCYMVLSYGIHYKDVRTIEIFKTKLHLN